MPRWNSPSARGIPEDPASSHPDQSFRAAIPGEVLVPGVEIVVVVDPDSIVPRAAGSGVRLPARGRLALDVVELPRMELTVVPVLVATDPDSSALDWAEALGPDHPAIGFVSNALPAGDLKVTVRDEPFVTTSPLRERDDWHDLLLEIQLLRALDRAAGYYYGVVSAESRGLGVAGIGYRSNPFRFLPLSLGIAHPETMAHELGHNMSLGHAPCDLSFGAGRDPGYPYGDGTIGIWGYDARADSLVPPSTPDLMSYCRPAWISDYNFAKALRYRLAKESAPPPVAAADVAGPRQLLLWGTVSEEGELQLNPAFVLDMPAQPSGPRRLLSAGRVRGGRRERVLARLRNE